MKFIILKYIGGKNYFSKTLRKIRIKRKMTKKHLAELIGKHEQQIQRYESCDYNQQYPPLDVLVKLCIALQISPNKLLGVKYVNSDEPPETGVIYEWELKGDAVYWKCPYCKGQNITYNNFTKNSKLIYSQNFLCEYDECGKFFDKLNKE